MKKGKTVTIVIVVLFLLLFSLFIWRNGSNKAVFSFEECAKLFPVMESYPEQCGDSRGNHFVRDIGNEIEKSNLIRSNNPRPGDVIESPLDINGEARGYWFFEASFPVTLEDELGNILLNTFVEANPPAGGDWMTEDFVPYQKTIEFEKPKTKKGKLILHKDNPSGLPEHDDALIIPIVFN